MAFLAVKNIGVFIFNTESERIEIERMFTGNQKKSFLSNEQYMATKFAETSKIKGFNDNKEINFIKDIETLEKNTYCINVSLVTGENFYSVINSFPYLCTNKILKYNYITKSFDEDICFGTDTQRVLKIKNQIQNYQILTNTSKTTATESYVMAFRQHFGVYPWKIMTGCSVLRDSTRLKFDSTCSEFCFCDKELKQVNKTLNVEIFHKDIVEIEPLSLGLQFHDKILTNVIEAVEGLSFIAL